uniref:Retinoic acid receptor responder protein 2 n=1 Tax=Sinocyclocheilus grahami TaxID=75366 RepID=A0A672RPY4_SINGR
MAVLLWVVLLSAGVSLSQAQESFSKLPDIYKKGVELALRAINAHHASKDHFLFLKSIHQAEIEAGFDVVYIYHNFYLKGTKCKRGTENADTTSCAFRNDRPLVDCVVCYKISAGKIDDKPQPYLSCMYRRSLSKESMREREIGCFRAGFGSLTPTPVPFTGS